MNNHIDFCECFYTCKIVAGICHALALSNANEVYFWGSHPADRKVVAPVKIRVSNVVDIAAINRCHISALTTSEGKVYFWGYAYGHLISEPVATEFSSMAKVFASLDIPMMLEPVEFELKQQKPKFRLSLDDQVRYLHLKMYFLVQPPIISSDKILRKQLISSSVWMEGLFTPTKRF